jgi:queuine/archaeosine tRNA-ribosyltransferase
MAEIRQAVAAGRFAAFRREFYQKRIIEGGNARG